MTIQEIDKYLNNHYFLVFRYGSEYYSLKKSPSFLCTRYSLIPTDSQPHHRNSLEKLFNQVCFADGILLIKAINDIEVLELNDPAWKTYEAVRHSAIIYKDEIHFSYQGISIWISHTDDGLSHLSDDLGNTQVFDSCRGLFEDARINGNTLKQIWDEVIVDAC